MNDGFYIVLNMRVTNGFEKFAQFYLGEDHAFAKTLFSSLKCQEQVGDSNVLHVDLVERRKNLPIDISILNCTLEDVTHNCRIICMALFKKNNLGMEDF